MALQREKREKEGREKRGRRMNFFFKALPNANVILDDVGTTRRDALRDEHKQQKKEGD